MEAAEQPSDDDPLAVAALPGEVPGDAAEVVADGPPDLDDPSLYFARQLSWMDFNNRVL
ncbi:MAG: hypothetical protein ACR2K6_03325 [Solirubrobacterales bacterium]